MKQLALILLAAMLCLLCACGVTTPEETSAITTTSQAVAVSVVYLSETIEAPTSYQAAPAEYKPVLDDYYLFQQIFLRYEYGLNMKGNGGGGPMRECEALQGELVKHGYISHSVPRGEHADYAVADINSDGIPELLLLQRISHWNKQKDYSIDSIYTIKNGKAVPVLSDIMGSFYMSENSILAADGTFYRVEDYHNVGCANLYSYQLEAGATELSLLEEYHAALSFSDEPDALPVPYWYRVVDGDKEEITEKEFDGLKAKYENPGKQMELTFIPIDANAAAYLPEDTTAKAPPPIKCPASYKDAPKAYKPILDDLYRFVQLIRRDDWEEFGGDYVWGNTHISEMPYHADGTDIGSNMGYAVVDINRDGIPELLLLQKDSWVNRDEHFIYSLFTLKDNEPINIGYYWSRHRGHLAADGTVYTRGSGGAAYTYLTSYNLKPGAAELTRLTAYQSDVVYEEDTAHPYFSGDVNGKNQYITEKEFFALCDQYENPPNPMKLNFIPIQQ